jgi:hypothetical protein
MRKQIRDYNSAKRKKFHLGRMAQLAIRHDFPPVPLQNPEAHCLADSPL